MDSSIISGLIGGIASLVICTYISKKVRCSSNDGQLKFGTFMIVLASVCVALSAFAFTMFFIDNDVSENNSELLSTIALFLVFGVGAGYCFGEYFKVKGEFDETSIQLYTPWTGKKNEKWENLKSIKFNSIANWYVLSFKSGTKIRLSNMLSGHGDVLEFLRDKGHEL